MIDANQNDTRVERTTLRWPYALYSKILSCAQQNRRSLTHEIIVRLEQSLEANPDFSNMNRSEQEEALVGWWRGLSDQERKGFGAYISGAQND